ncbi:MAG: NAD(P)/FAD-dependent oxidoreductase [Bacillota bacterium]
MKKYDIAVIGGGVVGCEIARRMTARNQSVVLIEKEADVASFGATKANSGIVHAGFDCKVGTLKAKLNVEGSEMYPALCKRLSVELDTCGALVVGRKGDEDKIQHLFFQGVANGVKNLEIIGSEQIAQYIKNPNPEITCALHAGSSAVVSPYHIAIAMAEEAVLNGCDVLCESEVFTIQKNSDSFTIFAGENTVKAKIIINACGANAEKINKIVGAEAFNATFARGEYMLLDLSEKDIVSATIFPLPTKLGKGVLCSPTAHGNIILGPTAIACDGDDTVVTQEGLAYIKQNLSQMVDGVNLRKNIRVFSGVRTVVGDDFIIEKSKTVENYLYLGGICSPGLSSAPAIAKYVEELLSGICEFKDKENQILRTPYTITSNMTDSELDALIKQNPAYGEIVCRCEKITRGEIIEAINSPLKPRTIDGIKRRVRAGMGRCQGGFCMPSVMEIIENETGMPQEKITKFGVGSEILQGGDSDEL